MRKLSVRLLILSLFFLSSAAAVSFAQEQGKFEGTVSLKLKGKKGDNDLKYYAKDDMARIEMGENAKKETNLPLMGTVIFKAEKMFILMPSRKTYVEKPLNIANKLNELSRREDLNSKVTKTSDEKDILGHKAFKWLIKTKSGDIELWSTNELGNFLFFQNDKTGAEYPDWFKRITEGGFFPLLVVQHDLNGNEINSLEVTDIKKGSVDGKYFEIPADFRRTEGKGGQGRHGTK